MLQIVYTNFKKVVLAVAFVYGLTFLHIFSFYTHQATRQADCIVVFGAAVWPGYYGPVASHALADRTLAAAGLYDQKLSNCIILSGADSVYGAHEVDVMTDILLENGVPESAISLDREGFNTMATIGHLSKGRSYILVSNDFHLARSGLLAQRAGLQAGPQNGFTLHAATYQSGGRYAKEYYFTLREAVAFWYYFFLTLI